MPRQDTRPLPAQENRDYPGIGKSVDGKCNPRACNGDYRAAECRANTARNIIAKYIGRYCGGYLIARHQFAY